MGYGDQEIVVVPLLVSLFGHGAKADQFFIHYSSLSPTSFHNSFHIPSSQSISISCFQLCYRSNRCSGEGRCDSWSSHERREDAENREYFVSERERNNGIKEDHMREGEMIEWQELGMEIERTARIEARNLIQLLTDEWIWREREIQFSSLKSLKPRREEEKTLLNLLNPHLSFFILLKL